MEQGPRNRAAIGDLERRLLLIVQEGIPLVTEPYREIAERLGTTEEQVLAALISLLERRAIKRLAAVPNHYALGVTHNGMSVWNVPDEIAGEIGRRLGQRDEITHCYRRPRAPGWPYNVFAMVHGTSREEVMAKIEAISGEAGLGGYEHDVLFSTRLLKKQGMRVRAQSKAARNAQD
ncbi:MAG: Lrp/AsnC family transcriptional regulator [Dehalococcoidia bacterium]|nr:Lrp/AsnC family transcriptional regulator [Dehalococcoidia bacterium]